MATIKNILLRESERGNRVVLYREGIFLIAYDWSAYLFSRYVHPYSVRKKHYKVVRRDVCSLGFPQKVCSTVAGAWMDSIRQTEEGYEITLAANNERTETDMVRSSSIVLAALLMSALFFSCGRGTVDPCAGIVVRVTAQASPEAVLAEMQKALDSLAAASPAALRPAVQAVCRALVDAQRHPEAVSVAALAFGINETENPEIAARLLTSILLPGTAAPPIAGLPPMQEKPGFILLLFHESSCRSCGNIVWDLREHYSELQKLGVRVVTISTDSDKEKWAEYTAKLPWPDKLCDYQGFYSPAMIAYGVAATPALFLIDENGTVVDQFTTFGEVWETISNRQ